MLADWIVLSAPLKYANEMTDNIIDIYMIVF